LSISVSYQARLILSGSVFTVRNDISISVLLKSIAGE
jgi:hypothetical protein